MVLFQETILGKIFWNKRKQKTVDEIIFRTKQKQNL